MRGIGGDKDEGRIVIERRWCDREMGRRIKQGMILKKMKNQDCG